VKSIVEIVYIIIRITGISYCVRWIFARNQVSIIFYHNPEVKTFESHANFLSRRYNLISLKELSDAIYDKHWKNIPKYAMVVTFDDGWKENFHLVNIFKKYNFRPTIFLTSHLINTERNFWWTVCSNKDLQKLKRLPNSQRLKVLEEKYFYFPEKEYSGKRQALNLSEIQSMKEYVDFGIHTCFHPVLTKCNDEEKRSEIGNSITRIKELLNIPLSDFAYPNGNYNNDCIKTLKEFGIKTARTVDFGLNDKYTDPYKLKIAGVSDDGSVSKLAVELTGIPMLTISLINWFLKLFNKQL
jgi:poly-beta-1,6-N-acetyl-D-glucosamine N-deacetylase